MVGTKRRWYWLFNFVCPPRPPPSPPPPPGETKHIENHFRISLGDFNWRFIPSPENRNVHITVRKVFNIVHVSKLELVLWI